MMIVKIIGLISGYNAPMQFPVEIHDKYLKIAEELGIDPEEIEEHHTRGGGPGGQKVNKTTSCVELHHLPTGIDVRYQHHRGLLANRKGAYELLIKKIEEEKKGAESELGKKKHKIQIPTISALKVGF